MGKRQLPFRFIAMMAFSGIDFEAELDRALLDSEANESLLEDAQADRDAAERRAWCRMAMGGA